MNNKPDYIKNMKFLCAKSNFVVPGTKYDQMIGAKYARINVSVKNCTECMTVPSVSMYLLIPRLFGVDMDNRGFNDAGEKYFIDVVYLDPLLLLHYVLQLRIETFVIHPDYLVTWKTQNRSRVRINEVKTTYGVRSQCTDGKNMAEVLFYVDDQTSITHVT